MLALIAATEYETCLLRRQLSAKNPLPGGFARFSGRLKEQEVVLVHSGIGKANAAAATTALLCSEQPDALINIGCGGAYLNSGLQVGDLALASCEVLDDEGSDSPNGFLDLKALRLPLCLHGEDMLFNRLPLDGRLLEGARDHLTRLAGQIGVRLGAGPFVTVSTCTGTERQGETRAIRTGGICENMEGGAIALVALRFQIPFLEFRGISNLASDRNRDAWDLSGACRVVQEALLALLQQWPGEQP